MQVKDLVAQLLTLDQEAKLATRNANYQLVDVLYVEAKNQMLYHVATNTYYDEYLKPRDPKRETLVPANVVEVS